MAGTYCTYCTCHTLPHLATLAALAALALLTDGRAQPLDALPAATCYISLTTHDARRTTHDSRRATCCSYDRTIKLWELCEGECQCVGSLGTRGSVWTMAVHEGLLLGAIGDSSIKVRPKLGLGLGVGAGDGVRGSLGSDG